jgi:hypothetical protein
VVDLAYDEQNIKNVIALVRGADQLFIEAPFLDVSRKTASDGSPALSKRGSAGSFHFISRLATATERRN